MGWRDDYRPGAFRGVAFHLKNSSSSGGRRTVLNEYPLRDEPYTEDMGRRARKFQLSMTVIGQDYMAQRDRLIEALETSGSGTLMHPFRGELQVAVFGDYSCEESTEQGGLARISVTFVESGTKPRPDSQVAQGALGNLSADKLQADALDEFVDSFSVTGWAGFVADSAIDVLQDATQMILNAGGLLEGSGEFGTLYRRLTGSFQQLILAPGNLAGSLLGLVRSLSGSASTPLDALNGQMSLFGLGNSAKTAASSWRYQTPARMQVVKNQTAVYRLIERASVSEAVRLVVSPAPNTSTGGAAKSGTSGNASASAPSNPSGSGSAGSNAEPVHRVPGIALDNRDQALDIRDQILDELDRQQLTAPPARYRPLAKLSADLVSETNKQSAALAPLTQVTPVSTLPALLLAHQLYGDARQVEQISTRNRISHPGFVPGGATLEVLKNA